MKVEKYPRTYHLPRSMGATSDDKVMTSDPFLGKRVVVTEKMDGENTSLYSHKYHARSVDPGHHVSRSWIKQFHASLNIPEGMKVCGENMYAKHSIFYESLASYFYVFSIWEEDCILSWADTQEWCQLLGLVHVPVIFKGTWTSNSLDACLKKMDLSKQEGLVVRLESSFLKDDFPISIGKYVRKGHVSTDRHWTQQCLISNKLRS